MQPNESQSGDEIPELKQIAIRTHSVNINALYSSQNGSRTVTLNTGLVIKLVSLFAQGNGMSGNRIVLSLLESLPLNRV